MGGKGKTLRLLVDSYDQPQEGHSRENPSLVTYSRGDVFEARTDAEYDRLVEIEAALDPQEDLKRRKEAAQAEADRLREEAAQLEEQAQAHAAAVEGSAGGGDLSDLTKPELQKRAKELDISGQSSMTKDELVAAIENAGGGGESSETPPEPPEQRPSPEEAAAAAVGAEPQPE